ncbi:serine/threonine protein phosphatase, partial [Clostridium perfringens]|nr:serine/threonine protein phosphatase [Clostridium perfringens]
MSIYAMSDLHGCYNKFINMINLIDFNETDELYI